MEMILMLDALRLDDEPAVGAKAARLGELMAAGSNVPPGFVITADGQRAAPDDVVTEPLLARVSTAYTKLGRHMGERDPRVAVRSSVVRREDDTSSFAGIYETVTNVRGVSGIADAIGRCWASRHTRRAEAYRTLRRLPEQPPMAVLVQAMVPSVRGGVACTSDPAGRPSGMIVVEASYGHTATVVSGLVEPDTYLVNRASGHVVEVRLGSKAMEILPARSGETTITVGTARRHARALCAPEASQIARTVLAAEDHFGHPQQLEWCYDEEGTLYVLQCRPLPSLDLPAAAPHALGAMLATGAGASPGRSAGRARVLASPDEAHLLRAGEVLVVTSPGPDWVPCLGDAAAVVADRGGVTSHLAVVCRELGTPCVVGTRTASVLIRSGDVVAVDGTDGTVRSAPLDDTAAGAPGARS